MWRGRRAWVPAVLLLALLAVDAETNYALLFTGAGYVSIADNTAFPSGSSSYTLEAWIKPTRLAQLGIVGFGSYAGTSGACNSFGTGSSFSLANYWWAYDLQVTTKTALSNGVWHHVAATGNSTTRAIWVNGTMIGFDKLSSSLHVVPSTVQNVRIGMTCTTCSPIDYFEGWIDEVRVWSVARTGAQLRSGMYSQLASSTSGMVGQWHFDEG
jgi:hypothetical protein